MINIPSALYFDMIMCANAFLHSPLVFSDSPKADYRTFVYQVNPILNAFIPAPPLPPDKPKGPRREFEFD